MKSFALSAATVLLLSSSAMAQTATPATPATPALSNTEAPAAANTAPGAAMSNSGSGGMMMGDTATVALKFVEISQADVMASKLEDLDVYNNDNENIGEVEDLVIKDGKTISGVVVSVGGFLGIGDRYVLLDPSSIVLNEKDGTMRAYVNTNKDALTKAPAFEYKDED
jgi:sporulation protein YlmC with PRC-barrel domain